MVDVKIILEWLKIADEDFDFAVSSLEDSTFYAQICFHFQQAAEKYLKTFIIANELDFKKIHDLSILLKICTTKDESLKSLTDDCRFLNRFYIATRYPVHWSDSFTEVDAADAKDAAEKIRHTIRDLLKF
jgi:HEPN domain-containing protein